MVDIDLVVIEVAKLLFETNIHFSELIHQNFIRFHILYSIFYFSKLMFQTSSQVHHSIEKVRFIIRLKKSKMKKLIIKIYMDDSFRSGI